MAHHGCAVLAGGTSALRYADNGCWYDALLYFLLRSDDDRRLSSESTAQLGSKCAADCVRGQHCADPIHNSVSRKCEALAVHTALAPVKYVLPFGLGSPGPLLPLSQAVAWGCAFFWYSLPGAWHQPSQAQCWARAGARVSSTLNTTGTESARTFLTSQQKRGQRNAGPSKEEMNHVGGHGHHTNYVIGNSIERKGLDVAW